MRTVDLLALDDRGAQSNTAWAHEKLYQLVTCRVHPGAQQPSPRRHVELDRARFDTHSRIASRLEAAVHVYIAVPDTCGKVEKDDMIR